MGTHSIVQLYSVFQNMVMISIGFMVFRYLDVVHSNEDYFQQVHYL